MSKPLRGDAGLTDLSDKCDLPKYDQRFEVLGTLDEASSALGVVRASDASAETRDLLLAIQHDLCWMMSELALMASEGRPEPHITPARLRVLEDAYHAATAAHPLGSTFAVPGDSMAGALLHLARTIVRRAERHAVLLNAESPLPNPHIIPYLNRLSTLLFALVRVEEARMGVSEPTLMRSSNEVS